MSTLKNRFLALPLFYRAVQGLAASRHGRRKVLSCIDARPGDLILDVGCGPASLLQDLPEDVTYIGYDLNEKYIRQARERYSHRKAQFHLARISAMHLPDEIRGRCHRVLAMGVLHHLDDPEVGKFFELVEASLAPKGKLVTVDAATWPGQGRIARTIVKSDRGQYVRQAREYIRLFRELFPGSFTVELDNLSRMPYTHIVFTGSIDSVSDQGRTMSFSRQ
jgi:cyclopropane fatty-acyl-phospholipid synthase-like methyltransferase